VKKLCIFIYSLGGGGAEKAALELAIGLQNSYDVKIMLFSDVVKYELPASIDYEILDEFDFYSNPIKKLLKLPLLAYKYANFCKKNSIDISLSFLSRPNIISILSKFFGNQTKIIISEHSTPSYYYGSSLPETILKKMLENLYPKADKIIAVSKGTKDDLVTAFNVPESKITILHNPIDIERIKKMAKEHVDFDFDGFIFITCGRLIESKNTAMLIRAFAKASLQNTKLLILGEGEDRESLEKLSKAVGVDKSVYFIGFTQNPYAYMNKADCFVFGSKLEALPTVLIEALSCNLPIISTDCPSGPDEILCGTDFAFENGIKTAKYGILTELDNEDAFCLAMKTIFTDETLRQKYKKNSSIRAMDFEKTKIFENYKAYLN